MLFLSVEDFLTQTGTIPRLSRDEEKALAARMASGDRSAREVLVRSYLPQAAGFVRRAPRMIRSLRTVYACIATVETCVDRFPFLQSSEPFAHHLARSLRHCLTECLANR